MGEAVRKRSVVLLSGGLDSAANIALCAEKDAPVLALTCRYGQRAAEREVEAARKICNFYDIRHEIVELPWLGAIGGSALTDSSQALPTLEKTQLDDLEKTRQTARSVWVPNRNGILINVAAAYAERLGAEQVVVGFNREEAATFADNSMAFLRRVSDSLALSTGTQVRAASYTAEMDKKEIVRSLMGLKRVFPFEWIWSCYTGGPTPCGVCESCKRLERAMSVRNGTGRGSAQ